MSVRGSLLSQRTHIWGYIEKKIQNFTKIFGYFNQLVDIHKSYNDGGFRVLKYVAREQ